ncbi:PH domain-containing protein [Fusarium mundagurra]|uniref:PH domain-containing protein n=1 Tax=Fusarium mundagurra TaxID=1567541 RepID=A0A8H5YEE0_9HYPO|nr:PH domain-containing protein [Fusarium mundagurra]
MGSETSSGTLPDPSTDELEFRDLQGQATDNDVVFNEEDDDNTALNVCIDNVPIRLPLFPQETFTNPPTYSREETISGIQRGCDSFWNDVQANGSIQPENPVTEAPPPTNVSPTVHSRQQTKSPTETASVPQSSPAPSAAPNVKPVPQAKTRGVKRAREPEPSPQATKRPADENGQPATKKVKSGESPEPRAAKQPTKRNRQPATKEVKPAKPRRYVAILPKPPPLERPMIYQQQSLPVNMLPSRVGFQYVNAPVSFAATGGAVRNLGQQHNRHVQPAQMGLSPHSIPSPHNGNILWSSPVLPQQQARMGISPPGIPLPHSGSTTWSSPGPSVGSWEEVSANSPMDGGALMGRPVARRTESSPMLPQQQAWMGANPHGVPFPHNGDFAWSPPALPPQQLDGGMTMGSMGHHKLRGNAMMYQNNGPVVNAPSSFMRQRQARGPRDVSTK